MAATTGPRGSASVAAYGRHWEQLHGTAATSEWHTTWADLRAVALPYLMRVASQQPPSQCQTQDSQSGNQWATVMDVGCGSSQMGHQLLQEPCLGFNQLLLVDAATAFLQQLKANQAPTLATETCKLWCIEYLAADCRRLPLQNGCCHAIIDKGTLDALWSDTDKVAMLQECARVLHPQGGIMLSISFSSPARLKLIQQHCPSCGLQYRVHVIGKGDPARGHEVRFLTLMSHDFGGVPYQPDALTQLLLSRLQKTGSLLDTEHDDQHDDQHDSSCAAVCALFE